MKNVRLFLTLAVVFIVSAATVTSCKKYEDGPMLSLRTKTHRVVNDWKLETYYLDDVNKTDSLGISNYTESFKDDGTVLRSFISVAGDTVSDTCTWAFANKKENLELTGADSLEISEQIGFVTPANLKILRLKEKELWYSFEKNGATHEFHLLQK
ncbi:MAG: hypothetical protein FD123_579 [Bacteroidetes bacterium]|nr:MAG: hypothetical protein FD123_579 [Bacteroidota bacterium]